MASQMSHTPHYLQIHCTYPRLHRYSLTAFPQSRKSPEQGKRPYRGEVSSLTTVLSGRESWLERVSSWGGVVKS